MSREHLTRDELTEVQLDNIATVLQNTQEDMIVSAKIVWSLLGAILISIVLLGGAALYHFW
ncbi:hypothetical protein HZC00_05705 [Candidatus Kaiserbacteria bacterium]|nr:hypothetical protein [Candidatus Kaiserbacteria bacterium]